ncbi:uncharacterized protein LOC127793928 isoform X2 [Diospyros lotus]|uniref:uncharacterized protein LOC127793928 isoform X2 n=1 Tax=Diospyros lotus TaxID=55363 RepID=UPI0022515B58|nr:uncharacterized protein LOC127793928 isoform X2 [Diospyros lotus]
MNFNSAIAYVLCFLILHIFASPSFHSRLGHSSAEVDDFAFDTGAGLIPFYGDYSLPSQPPPSPPPHPPPSSCEEDLNGVGSLDATCVLGCSLNFTGDVFITGNGSLQVLPGVKLSCSIAGCSILVNVSREFRLGLDAELRAGTVFVEAGNATLFNGSVINVTALAGAPPAHTSGTPTGVQGGGGGHGGRGASCVMDNTKLPEDVWGGDAYSWLSLAEPWSYGSKGGTTDRGEDYGGKGGGRIGFNIKSHIQIHGSLLADGGDGGIKGGGGSGGSINIKSPEMSGSGNISASGGNGFAGGGGGRVSVNVISRHDDQKFLVHGGRSYGCPGNSGAAGTFYDVVLRRLYISNHNMSTDTDTLLLEVPNQPMWTSVYIQNRARATVPLLWSRVQVLGQLSLSCSAVLSFGLAHYSSSQFELIAEELLMSDSIIKVYGALRMAVKIHLMSSSKIIIDGDGDALVATSLLEASNLVVLQESSVIHSNADLGVHGQGYLYLVGPGDVIEAEHLVLSLFYSISIGPGSILRGPLKNSSTSYMTPGLYCELQDCPVELLHPPEDCNVNSSLSFTIEICRVEDVTVEGLIEGSVVHLHWVRTVVVEASGAISASGLGCTSGIGRGRFLSSGLGGGGGGGHGGKGGSGYYNGSAIQGGIVYGNADLPCELGSGSGNDSLAGSTSGGGIIVMGSMEHSLSSLAINGSLKADGESSGEHIRKQSGISNIGPGGGSGGTILLFVHKLALGEASSLSTVGGHGGPNSGGGGGGRIHLHWSDILTGDEYLPMASVQGTIHVGGGVGNGQGNAGEDGTVTGKSCPRGLYGIFCQECPVGTFKNVSGSDRALCRDCPSHELPHRAIYISVRGGVADTPCPYKCISDRYHMPHCHTALEELVYTFGGPWLFGFLLLFILIMLALVLSVARMKFVNVDELPGLVPNRRGLQMDHSFPFLESLNEVLETSRTEESQTHVHRMYFTGSNTFSEPWHLPYSPPEQVKELVYEDAFNIFVDEINALAAYQWWEGSVYSILFLFVYPFAWSWLQWRRKKKIQRLREFVRSEYDHACLRSCRSRALYEGLKCIPPTIWFRLVAGLNAQLRLVRRGRLRKSFRSIKIWLETHANPTLGTYGVRVDLACFQPSVGGYCQFGLSVHAVEDESSQPSVDGQDVSLLAEQQSSLLGNQWRRAVHLLTHKRAVGGIIQTKSLRGVTEKKTLCYPLSFILYNTKPVGHQDLVGLVISILLLGDFSLVLLTLLQLYSISLLDLFLFMFILPLGILFPLPAGINALFSHGPRESAGLARIYALWNIMSLINVVVGFLCGCVHSKSQSSTDKNHHNFHSWNFSMDESGWWLLPSGLVLCIAIQAKLINYHVANLEVQDRTLYSDDPDLFWQS